MKRNLNEKITTILSILLFSIAAMLSSNAFAVLTIGQTGPAGGLVFQVTRDGLHGLEAAKVNQGNLVSWSNGATSITTMAVKSGLRDGGFNTDRIIITQGNGNYAALQCANYNGGGYGDWYLPSKDELNLMYKNLHLKGLGGFANSALYWSSTEFDGDQAWYQDFFTGQQGNLMKLVSDTQAVRCIRAI